MKKILSIGALGLVVAASTSIWASATTLSSTDTLILKAIANQYNKGENQTGLLV